MARLLLYIWLGTLGLFALLIILNLALEKNWAEPLQTILIIDIVTGVASFILMCIFAFFGAAIRPEERKVGLEEIKKIRKSRTVNRPEINKYLLITVVLLLVGVAYLVGKLQTNSAKPQVESAQYTSPTTSPTPTVAIKPAVTRVVTVIPTPTNPPERKKVLINVDDYGGLTKGNFYCYEDKVNELADIQNNIRVYQAIADSCNSIRQANASQCASSCPLEGDIASCVHACYDNASPDCNEKNTKVGDLRKELYSKVHEYCP
jgi:hypothetical protein